MDIINKLFIEQLRAERQRQMAKWGPQSHRNGTGGEVYASLERHYKEKCAFENAQASGPSWATILLEEVYEAMASNDPASLRTELVQAATVIAAWLEDLDKP